MRRIENLIKDWRKCRDIRNDYYIRWHIVYEHKDIPACSFFLIPTIVYNTYPYRRPGDCVFNVYFLHWYLGIGEWGLKVKRKRSL